MVFLLLIGMTLTSFVKISIAHNPYLIPSPPYLASTSTISTSYSYVLTWTDKAIIRFMFKFNLYIVPFIHSLSHLVI